MERYQTLLYYCYSPIVNAEDFAADHLKFCKSLGLVGRIIVADEGLNGTVSGTPEACKAYMEAIHVDERFAKTEFKIDEVDEPSFVKMHCRYKSEIVHSGLRDPQMIDPNRQTGKHLEPAEFLAMKDRDDVVILDVRSDYEHSLGRFKNAVTLDIENFRDFPAKINELAKFKDKKILTYCTGGIKCEKASALLLHEGFSDVYQLHGGIIKYGKEAGGEDFDGKCYVFDNRLAVDVNTVNPVVVSTCYNCGKTTDKMINCANPECNEHFTQCDECGTATDGCCSTTCQEHPRKRIYDGTGYYVKVPQPVNVKKVALL
ncbi:oxygen-dependent tRNA uridine(34) hydroxylase TrhO [Mucilaginibacter myungsuensis]|uniref:tRNA uridine(34) hydroxylase n=1 Tax=Mucilaginibacter myungsuensis TaxID=649104 RepID=A0A929PVJ3_9SPHI|nr:rhodanese-related sulfurtransferase [Mucilaginibacter myungsuensis]MBE9661071.1 rhodanese-related sulfurtransferase [Mucilaginibacter myungsuensis]MDN3597215.1 rhodanese-related sulfurtransferase [Mucilaginibacter myungsuensis]